MFRVFLVIIFLLSFSLKSIAFENYPKLRISLLTCGTGTEVWETFGHTALRVIDSSTGEDVVFNYGMFNGYDEGFLLQFVRGKLPYYVSYYPYSAFLEEYQDYGRSIDEQELLLNDPLKTSIRNFLLDNCEGEHKYYRYDFFFDNCATRIRDIFPKVLGDSFHYELVLSKDKKLSFRNIINQYFHALHWQRFGVNLALGNKIDKVMSNEEIMFLPDFLSDGIAHARFNNQPIVGNKQLLLKGSPKENEGLNGPLILMFVMMMLTIAGFRFPVMNKIMNFMLFFITGILGCVMLLMWFATDHQTCQNNFNLLWALPTNLILAFSSIKNKERYALVAIFLLLVAMFVHLFHIQEFPLTELSPLLLALLLTYGNIFRQKNKPCCMETRQIETDISTSFHYRIAGNGHPLVLLHGFPEDGSLWEAIGDKLSSHFKVIIPDIPGSGESSLDKNNVSLEEIARSINQILVKEKLDQILLVGHSMGGYICLAFAQLFPEKLVGLSMVHSTAAADNEEKKETRRKTIKLIEKGGKKPFVQQMIPSLFSPFFIEKFPEKIELQINRGLALKEESMIAYYKAIIERLDRISAIAKMSFPLQWILGKEDNLLPFDKLLQQTRLANVNFVSVYNNCGHMSMLENPEELYNDLKMFADFCYKGNNN